MKQVEIGIKGRPFIVSVDVSDNADPEEIVVTISNLLLNKKPLQTDAGPLVIYTDPEKPVGLALDYVLVLEPKQEVIIAPPTAGRKWEEGVPFIDTIRMDFLGQRLTVIMAILDTGQVSYYLPLFVNGRPALECMNKKNLSQIILDWHGRRGDLAFMYTAQVILDERLENIGLEEETEILEFVKDYYDRKGLEIIGAPITKTAKAFFGWKDGPGEDQD